MNFDPCFYTFTRYDIRAWFTRFDTKKLSPILAQYSDSTFHHFHNEGNENIITQFVPFCQQQSTRQKGIIMNKFDRDLAIVNEILSIPADTLTHDDRMELLKIYHVAYHDSGKIEDVYSLDSSAHHCEFCNHMRKAGEHDSAIICNLCYDIAQENRWKNVLNRHGLNLRIMSSVLFEKDELATLNVGHDSIVRGNSSGDIENTTHARNYLRIFDTHPDTNCALWSKNVPAVHEAVELEGKPSNTILVQSSPRIGVPVTKAEYFDYVFTVYATLEALLEAVRNGDNECNGAKCMACGFKCYKGTHEGSSNICEYLRCTDAQRRALIEHGCR